MELIDRFLSFEEKYNLPTDHIHDFFYWGSLRFSVYSALDTIYDKALPTGNRYKISKWKRLKIAFASLRRSPFLRSHSRPLDVIFVNHERRMRVDGMMMPIYFWHLFLPMEKLGKEYIMLEPLNIDHEHYQDEDFDRGRTYFTDDLSLLKAIYTRFPHFRDKVLSRKFRKIIQAINAEFGVSLSENEWAEKAEEHRCAYLVERFYFHCLLKKLNPQKIVEVVSYGRTALNQTARSLGIEVIELQHGTMGAYHVGYNYLKSKPEQMPYLPNKILLYSDYWRRNTRYPLPKSKQIVVGYPHIESMLIRYGKCRVSVEEELRLLVISQTTISNYLSAFVKKLLMELNRRGMKYRCYYKLHPSECMTWRDNADLLDISTLAEVVTESSKNIYEYFAFCNVQLGVYSTAIYEGLAFGLQSFVLDVPRSERLADLCAEGYATLVGTPDDFLEGLGKTDKHGTFWEQHSVHNILVQIL